jgi:hypothetical protein
MPARPPKQSDRPAYRLTPGEPSKKTSQSGYGHGANRTGTTRAVGTNRHASKRRAKPV